LIYSPSLGFDVVACGLGFVLHALVSFGPVELSFEKNGQTGELASFWRFIKTGFDGIIQFLVGHRIDSL
jgi:hypothetical protein